MEDEKFLKFAKESVRLTRHHHEKYLGPLPDFDFSFKQTQVRERSDVPCNIEELGVFLLFREGFIR